MQPRYTDDPRDLPQSQFQSQSPQSILDMLSFKKPAQRKRKWESQRPAASYRIPAPLIGIAKEAQENILACAETDEDGKPRSGMTVDMIADVVLRWAIKLVNENPKKYLPGSISPHTKSGATVYAAAWEDWNGTPPVRSTPRRRNKKNQSPRFHISYRIQEETKSAIKSIAQENGLSLGELFLYLLQFGLAGHHQGQYRIKPTTSEIVYSGADWVEVKK